MVKGVLIVAAGACALVGASCHRSPVGADDGHSGGQTTSAGPTSTSTASSDHQTTTLTDMGPVGEGCGDGVVEVGVFCFVEVEVSAVERPARVLVADLDDDGGPEVALGFNPENTGSGHTMVARWNGSDFEVLATHDEPAGRLLGRPIIGGGLELIGATGRLRFDGETLQHSITYAEGNLLAAIDVDSDGADEIVAMVYEGTPTVPVVRALHLDETQTAWLAEGPPILESYALVSVAPGAASDFDASGRPEVAILYELGGSTIEGYDPTYHRLGLFRPEGARFVEAWSGPAGIDPAGNGSVILADLDGDGVRDVVAHGGGGIALVRGTTDGGLGDPSAPTLDGYDLPWDGTPEGERIVAAAIGDLDGDARPEVLVTISTDDAYDLVIVRDPLGASSTLRLYTANSPASIAVGDINQDGIDDVLTSNEAEDGSILLLLISDP